MYILTGGAGFIGSCVLRALNDRGIDDVIVVDNIGSTEKWKNIVGKKYREYVNKGELFTRIEGYKNVECVIHMGAQSSTTEKNFDYLWSNNFEYTKKLWNYCASKDIPFIYASSAATYGDGANGFDDLGNIDNLIPLNGYGYSKQLFDLWVKHQANVFPKQYVGLKFFNVYGPNEYYKGSMASMVYHGFNQIKESGAIRLFKSQNPEFKDGGQLRDFVYVKDICQVIMWLLDHPNINGLFNVGTGKAQSFEELAKALFEAMNLEPNIEYIDMPITLAGKYQYYTQANMSHLIESGYTAAFRDVKSGVLDYVVNYLAKDFSAF